MAGIFEKINDKLAPFMGWLSNSFKQTTASYCNLETADSSNVLVTNDGSLLSIVKINGTKSLIGSEEFDMITNRINQSLHTSMSQPGHSFQVFFSYDRKIVREDLTEIIRPARETADRLKLDLEDLFNERVDHLSDYCAHEDVYIALYTKVNLLTSHQLLTKQVKKQDIFIKV